MTNQCKAVNAHDEFRGLYLFDWLGSPEPHIVDKIQVPRFFYVRTQREETKRAKSAKYKSSLGLGRR